MCQNPQALAISLNCMHLETSDDKAAVSFDMISAWLIFDVVRIIEQLVYQVLYYNNVINDQVKAIDVSNHLLAKQLRQI